MHIKKNEVYKEFITRFWLFVGLSIFTILLITGFKWEGHYEDYTYTPTVRHVEKQCEVDGEWIDVDAYQINLIFNDWYRIDGEKTYSQGKDLTCKTNRWIEELDVITEEQYKPGIRDFIFFWKDFKKDD